MQFPDGLGTRQVCIRGARASAGGRGPDPPPAPLLSRTGPHRL